ncbi:Spermidine synthase [Rhodopirellula islandica]|uniref:Spermidine synthase n=2 Tax=Rhodopirellula islandica TaxID=595434 RepID=A0A0J1EKH5_RHOIS|nr:Spermidine synthase [Rhodopirellula islandica]
MAALGHQLLWTRRLADLLGASGESTARVFGTFFLGLSIGSAIAALLVGRTRNPLRLAGLAQLSIPFLVVPVLYLSQLTDWIWPLVGADATHGSNGFAIRSLLTLGFVLPPAAIMGLSFPLIVAGLLRSNGGRLGRSGINLYAVNTIGGAMGVLFTIMVAIPQWGNFASMVLAASVDGAIGIALLICAKAFPTLPPRRTAPEKAIISRAEEAALTIAFSRALWLAFFSGAAVLAIEVAAFQMFQLVATISVFSPAAVLFCAIASLGIAAALFARFESLFVSPSSQRTIVLVLATSSVFVVLAPQVFMAFARQSNWFAENTSVALFVLKLGAMALLSVGPAWVIAGLIFPFAIASAGRQCSPIQSGQRVGLLLSVNGIGGMLGAELTYRVLLPTLGVYGTMTAIGMAFATVAALFSMLPCVVLSGSPHASVVTRVSAALCVSIVLLLGFVNTFLPVINPPPGIDPIDVQSGREGTVAVIEDRRGERSILVANQYLLGGTAVRYDQERQTLLPLVLHKQPSKVACIGLATGITPGASLSIPTVDAVVSIEISPLVARAAERHFSEFNHDICQSDLATVVVGDGRTYLASMTEQFDVITGDLFLPWASGTSRLYSREHFASVRNALKPGGIFCQWLPMYQLTPEQFELIADTFSSEFNETHLFMNHFRVASPMIALVGGKDLGCLDWKQVGQHCDQLREMEAIHAPLLRHESGVRLLHLGSWKNERGRTRLVSLADPSLEYSAAAVRLSAHAGKHYFQPVRWIEFCRECQKRIAREPPAAPGSQAELTLLATGLLEWDHARRTRNKLADSIGSRVARSIPRCLRDDHLADWDRWPGAPGIRWVNDLNTTDTDETGGSTPPHFVTTRPAEK